MRELGQDRRGRGRNEKEPGGKGRRGLEGKSDGRARMPEVKGL